VCAASKVGKKNTRRETRAKVGQAEPQRPLSRCRLKRQFARNEFA
jgi:hypothetical protein